jgi:hypothetical protein
LKPKPNDVPNELKIDILCNFTLNNQNINFDTITIWFDKWTQNRSETNPFVLNNIFWFFLFLKENLERKNNMTPFCFCFNPKRLNSTQLIKNNIGRRQSDRNWFETRSDLKQSQHKEKLMRKVKTKIQEIKGYNLINEAKLWYQMMWTSGTRGQATQMQDTKFPGSQVNQVW